MACRQTTKFSLSWYYHFVCAQPGMSKVPKIRILHIFAISRKTWGWSWYFNEVDKLEGFLQVDSITLVACIQACPNYPKYLTSLLFFCNMLRKKWVIKLIICLQISMKVSHKLILSFLMGWSSIPKVPKKFAISQKRSKWWSWFFACR